MLIPLQNVFFPFHPISASTLTSMRRRDEENYFSILLSGRFRPTIRNGAYFIDRDGIPFAPILRYLRTGNLVIPSHIDSASVYEEAEFYCIPLPPPHFVTLVPIRSPRVDGVYMDKSMSILIQFLPTFQQVHFFVIHSVAIPSLFDTYLSSYSQDS